MSQPDYSLELTGLDGSNPLAFLAALGVLRCLDVQLRGCLPRLGWTDAYRPMLSLGMPTGQEDVLQAVERGVKLVVQQATTMGDIAGVPLDAYQRFADAAAADPHQPADRTRLVFAAVLASDAVVDAKKGTVVPTALSFSNGQGGKLLLKDARTLAGRITADRIATALFGPWTYEDRDEPTFRWDPLDMRTGAHMATDPGSTETRSVMAANVLAFVGLSFFPTAPVGDSLRTTAVRRVAGDLSLTWPLWRPALGVRVISSLLQRDDWQPETGVIARFAARRIMFKKNLYLSESFAI